MVMSADASWVAGKPSIVSESLWSSACNEPSAFALKVIVMFPLTWWRPRRPVQSFNATCTTFGTVGSTVRVRHSSPSLSSAAAVAAADGSFEEMLERPVVPTLVLSAAAPVATFSSARSEEGAELHAVVVAAKAKNRKGASAERVFMGCFSEGVAVSPLVDAPTFTSVLN